MYSKVLCLLLISSFIGSSYQILCSNSCAVNETFSECGAGGGECQKTCRTRRRTEDLGCPCVAGCVCIDGYFRDPDTYKCIKRSDCGPIVALGQGRCPLNERWSKCSGGCQNDCNNIGALMKCACKSGCVCRIGYIRSPITNQCILEKACKTCPKNYIRDKETGVCKISCELCKDPNAVYNKCGSSCSEGTCKNPNGLSQICTKMCETGCFCKTGYVKNDAGKCVLPKTCPIPKCKDPNSYANECGSACEATCKNPNPKGPCPDVCVKGCFCNPGYLKNDQGVCVPVEKCPKACPKYEIFSCGSGACEKNCKNLKEKCTIVNIKCDDKCFCIDGYVRAFGPNGPCIPVNTCPIVDPPPTECADPNAEYTTCGSKCNQPKCSSVGLLFKCLAVCEVGCFCKKGFFLDSQGKCVAKCTECPENESFSCGSAACEKDCSNINEKCNIVNIKCDDKCFCNKGFVRAYRNGPCIPIGNCNGQCPANEIMDCRNPTCLNEGCVLSRRPCLDVPCEKRCYCADGFARINGVCVPREKCNTDPPPMDCKDPNASFKSCGSACEPTCDKPNPLICTMNCVSGCFCNAGYMKDSTGVCIPIEKCPKPSCKDPNSEYSCGNPYCEPSCSTLGQACDVHIKKCENKCYCKTGYVLSDSGICIPIEKCPKKCPLNEVFSCGSAACEKNCGNINEKCLIVNKKCDDKCFCIEGYVRAFGPNGPCISVETCPFIDPPPKVCPDPNAEYTTCGSACEPICGKADPMFCTLNCVEGCFCKAGFIKDSTGVCIPVDKCPKPKECPANEVYDCRHPTCGEQGCFWLCRPAPGTPCVNKCFCADGYRRINGICILEEKCPKEMITCNADETFECREPVCTGLDCFMTERPPKGSVPSCEYKCYCAAGLVNIDGKCVPDNKCPMPNTEYRTCVNPCTEPSCAHPTTALIKCRYACIDGCYCKKGFLKDDQGNCVEKCPSKECPENESFSCGSAACEKDCSNINETCDIVNIKCDDKCFCNKGFVRAYRNGPCIPIDQCNGQCPANEIMDCRNPTCLNEGCFLSKRACLDVPCEKRCYCQEGFARIDGVCVPREKCFNDQPMDCKDPNASYNTCGSACEPICGKKNPLFCTANCVVGCFCNKGYIKDSKGVCIPIEKCNQPKDCPANEVFDCRHPTCGERGCFVLCRPDKDTPCENRCFCADGYYRENGICIPEDKCPKEPITCDVNEVFECRNPTCDDEGCFMMGRPCQNVPCQYKCYCAPGLVRIDGKCVSRKKCFSPIEECLMPNTEYKTCVNPCTQPSCANPTTALIKCAYACVDGCFCSEGFYKSDDGSCIELDQCPRRMYTCPETCPANESCSCQLTDCERNCDNRRYPCDPIHPNCVTKCFCNSGFIRQYGGGPCIPYDQCGPIWGDLEIAEM
ncbi:unnamed protein product [Diamesa tonsa]